MNLDRPTLLSSHHDDLPSSDSPSFRRVHRCTFPSQKTETRQGRRVDPKVTGDMRKVSVPFGGKGLPLGNRSQERERTGSGLLETRTFRRPKYLRVKVEAGNRVQTYDP